MGYSSCFVGPENGLFVVAVIGFFFMAIGPLGILLIALAAAKRRPYIRGRR